MASEQDALQNAPQPTTKAMSRARSSPTHGSVTSWNSQGSTASYTDLPPGERQAMHITTSSANAFAFVILPPPPSHVRACLPSTPLAQRPEVRDSSRDSTQKPGFVKPGLRPPPPCTTPLSSPLRSAPFAARRRRDERAAALPGLQAQRNRPTQVQGSCTLPTTPAPERDDQRSHSQSAR